MLQDRHAIQAETLVSQRLRGSLEEPAVTLLALLDGAAVDLPCALEVTSLPQGLHLLGVASRGVAALAGRATGLRHAEFGVVWRRGRTSSSGRARRPLLVVGKLLLR